MAYINCQWSLAAFKDLCQNAFGNDLNLSELARALDISYSSCRNILNGGTVPQFSTIIKMSDFFAVPVDVLLGRCSKDEYDRLMNDYKDSFKFLRRYDYEEKLTEELISNAMNSVPTEFPDNYIDGGWPYNLLDILIQGHWPVPVSDDQNLGIVSALSTLSDREVSIIIKRYIEEKTLDICSQELNLTKERVRQIEKKAFNKLRHPTRFNCILYGKNGHAEKRGLETEVDCLKRERDALKHDIAELREIVQKEANDIWGNYSFSRDARYKALFVKHNTTPFKMPEPADMDSLNLSVRPYMCLLRANCKTVNDVIELAKKGELMKLRNFGKVSLIEVLTILKENYDVDLFNQYGLDNAS